MSKCFGDCLNSRRRPHHPNRPAACIATLATTAHAVGVFAFTAAYLAERALHRIRRFLVVSAAALVAGTTAVLALAAVHEAYGRDAAALLLALAAVWLGQGVIAVLRLHRPRERQL